MKRRRCLKFRRNPLSAKAKRTHHQISLRAEQLEERSLLAAILELGKPEYRVDEFSGLGDYTYSWSTLENDFRDTSQGTLTIQSGKINYESPTKGVYEVFAKTEGNGDSFVKIGSSMRKCSTYRAVHVGTIKGNYDNGKLTGNSAQATNSSYPMYTEVLKDDCEKPEEPTDWSPFNAQLSPLQQGSYDEKTYHGSFNWSGRYKKGNVSISVPPSEIVYNDNNQTDLVVQAKWNDADVEFEAEVLGKHMIPPTTGRASAVTNVRFFFTNSDQGSFSKLKEIQTQKKAELHWNTKKLTGVLKDIEKAPANARFILVEIDADNTVNEPASFPDNNRVFLPIHDIKVMSIEGGNPDADIPIGQIVVKYEIHPLDSKLKIEPFKLQLFGHKDRVYSQAAKLIQSIEISPGSMDGVKLWLHGESAQDALKAGKHELRIKIPTLSPSLSDVDTDFVLAVADVDNKIYEPDEHPINEDNSAVFSGAYQGNNGSPAVLRTANKEADEVILLAQGNQIVAQWQNRNYGFKNPSYLTIVTSEGDDKIKTDESSGKVMNSLRIVGGSGND